MPIAARALHVAERNADGCLRVARLNAQVQVHHGAATVAVDNEPVMICRERGGNLGPEPCLAFGQSVALKRRTVANASRCASHSRCIRVMLSPISSLRA